MRKETEEDILGTEEEQRDESMATYEDYLASQREDAEEADEDDDTEDAGDDNDESDSEVSGEDSEAEEEVESEEASEEESEGDSDEVTEDSSETEETKEEDGADEAADSEEVDPRVKLMVERAEARAEHAQQAHDALTGRYGKLVEDFQKLQKRLDSRETQQREERGDGYSHEYNESERSEIADLRRQVEEMKEQRREPVAAGEAAGNVILHETHQFAANDRYKADIAKYENDIKVALGRELEPGTRLQRALDSGDAESIRLITRDILREAYYDAREKGEAAERAKLAEENAKRKAKTSRELRRKKRAAAPAGVGAGQKKSDDSFDVLDPDLLTKNPALARDPKFLKQLERAGKRLGRK